jgi:hypothetical protein
MVRGTPPQVTRRSETFDWTSSFGMQPYPITGDPKPTLRLNCCHRPANSIIVLTMANRTMVGGRLRPLPYAHCSLVVGQWAAEVTSYDQYNGSCADFSARLSKLFSQLLPNFFQMRVILMINNNDL